MDAEKFIRERLSGRLWHSTSRSRFDAILADGFIRPEPDIPDSDRWSTRMGPEWYPFVRHINGFSLFEFPTGFNLNKYRLACPSASLEAFIPVSEKWQHAVWIEIDQVRQASALLSGDVVWARCEQEGHGKRCIPYLEAAHIGEMPVSSILNAYYIEKGDQDWRQIDFSR